MDYNQNIISIQLKNKMYGFIVRYHCLKSFKSEFAKYYYSAFLFEFLASDTFNRTNMTDQWRYYFKLMVGQVVYEVFITH